MLKFANIFIIFNLIFFILFSLIYVKLVSLFVILSIVCIYIYMFIYNINYYKYTVNIIIAVIIYIFFIMYTLFIFNLILFIVITIYSSLVLGIYIIINFYLFRSLYIILSYIYLMLIIFMIRITTQNISYIFDLIFNYSLVIFIFTFILLFISIFRMNDISSFVNVSCDHSYRMIFIICSLCLFSIILGSSYFCVCHLCYILRYDFFQNSTGLCGYIVKIFKNDIGFLRIYKVFFINFISSTYVIMIVRFSVILYRLYQIHRVDFHLDIFLDKNIGIFLRFPNFNYINRATNYSTFFMYILVIFLYRNILFGIFVDFAPTAFFVILIFIIISIDKIFCRYNILLYYCLHFLYIVVSLFIVKLLFMSTSISGEYEFNYIYFSSIFIYDTNNSLINKNDFFKDIKDTIKNITNILASGDFNYLLFSIYQYRLILDRYISVNLSSIYADIFNFMVRYKLVFSFHILDILCDMLNTGYLNTYKFKNINHNGIEFIISKINSEINFLDIELCKIFKLLLSNYILLSKKVLYDLYGDKSTIDSWEYILLLILFNKLDTEVYKSSVFFKIYNFYSILIDICLVENINSMTNIILSKYLFFKPYNNMSTYSSSISGIFSLFSKFLSIRYGIKCKLYHSCFSYIIPYHIHDNFLSNELIILDSSQLYSFQENVINRIIYLSSDNTFITNCKEFLDIINKSNNEYTLISYIDKFINNLLLNYFYEIKILYSINLLNSYFRWLFKLHLLVFVIFILNEMEISYKNIVDCYRILFNFGIRSIGEDMGLVDILKPLDTI